MAQGPLANILIALVVVGLVTTVLGGAYVSWGRDYNVTVDSQFAQSYNKLNETNKLTAQLSDKLQGSDVDTSSGTFAGVAGAALAIKLVLTTPFNTVKLLLETASTTIGIPPVFTASLLAIILIIIVFAVISIYFGKQRI